MTPAQHHEAALAALDLNRCDEDVDCRDVVLAMRHTRALVDIEANRPYMRAHRAEVLALIEMARRANEEQGEARAAAASAGPAPRPDERGGNFSEVRRFLSTHLDNPRSYQPVRCGTPVTEGAGWHVTCSFRARNRFNALVLQSWTFLFNRGHVVDGGPDEIIHH